MPHVFTYGSLMFGEVFERIVRHRYHSQHAYVRHFKRTVIRNHAYPVVLPSYGHRLDGELYFDVKHTDLRRLDIFEGEYYQRQQTRVTLGDTHQQVRADIYVLKPAFRHLASARPWSADNFRRHHLRRFARTYLPSQ